MFIVYLTEFYSFAVAFYLRNSLPGVIFSLGTPATVTRCCRLFTSADHFGRRFWHTAASPGGRKTCSPAWPTCSTVLPTRKEKWASYHPKSSLHGYARRMVRIKLWRKRKILEQSFALHNCCYLCVCLLLMFVNSEHKNYIQLYYEHHVKLNLSSEVFVFLHQNCLTTTCSRMPTSF